MLGEGRDIRALMMRMIRAGLSISLSFFMRLIAACAVRIVSLYQYVDRIYQQKKSRKYQSYRSQKYQRAMACFRDNAHDIAGELSASSKLSYFIYALDLIRDMGDALVRFKLKIARRIKLSAQQVFKAVCVGIYRGCKSAQNICRRQVLLFINKILPNLSHLEFRRDDRQKAMLMMMSFCVGVFLVFSFGMHEGETSPALQAKLIDNPNDINGKNAGHGADLGFGGFKLDLSSAHDVDDLRHLIARYPDAIIGMPASHLGTLFDAPAFVHQVDDVSMWQFSSEKCVIDVYFLGPDLGRDIGQSDDPMAGQIAHMDVRSRSDKSLVDVFDVRNHDLAISSCLSSIMRDV